MNALGCEESIFKIYTIHVILKTITRTKTLKGGGFGLTDILDDPIPSKLTLTVYSIWSMKCRYDPKYAPRYKSKDTKYVKLSKKILKPLDTQK